ncbi:uncharacterized protein LOC123314884 isoform X2 [Coccinella septempunctata]|uniref:uncharacterized protein LOC123314884 isoform X2 n=1 Tax=Coccinella septempunctata TaxID=41139 RepID=UPI001D06FF8C|nr:uncharacterized protein LOC123314884 isoform X2 [Coccinella septempunctata]
MAQKLSKKGRNPGAVDNWLEALGYYRKNVAYDETCLFRAVSEQLFNIQIYHERVRIDCINYAKKNLDEFLEFVETKEELVDHIEKLEKHMIICGNLEIQMLSRKYKCNITIFDASRQQADHIIKKGNTKVILLCLMNEDHYDAVYQREHIVTAGFCQSIVYKLLYENVFDIQNVDDIVQGMLYDKTYITTQADLLLDEKLQEHEEAEGEKDLDDHKESVVSLPLNIAPFPFKVAKALDPSIYRNIEYDSWTEVRREMRLGDWYYGDDKLILGTRCLFNDKDETYDCYIQDIIKNENKCVVYITKLAQKKVVNYSDLSPENDAKPWPLPYRFSKNLNISATTTILSLDKIKSHRRKKDKNQIKNESPSSNPGSDSLEHNVTAYVGAPLMQSPQNAQEENQDVINEANLDLINQDAQCNTPQRYQWEAPYYSYPGMMTPVIQEPFSWPPTPVSPGVFNFNVRPVMTPVATTPNGMHYCDVNQSPIYNYPVDPYHYAYQPWTQMPESQQSPTSPHPQVTLDVNNNKETTPTQKSQTTETNAQYVSYHENSDYTSLEQPVVCSSVPRVNPQMGMYSPIIPVPPGTPVIYSPTAEIIVPTTPLHMYTPSVEVPYIVPEQYSYPSTPNAAWYPVGVNAQGFIFPTQTVAKHQ